MSPRAISLIVFACIFGGAVVGIWLRSVLPEHHLSADSRTTVNLGIGLVATMAALALGLGVSSAASSYFAQPDEFNQFSPRLSLPNRTPPPSLPPSEYPRHALPK